VIAVAYSVSILFNHLMEGTHLMKGGIFWSCWHWNWVSGDQGDFHKQTWVEAREMLVDQGSSLSDGPARGSRPAELWK
jgi:hypothetical protein